MVNGCEAYIAKREFRSEQESIGVAETQHRSLDKCIVQVTIREYETKGGMVGKQNLCDCREEENKTERKKPSRRPF
jgi:hypothetical protein